VLDPLRRPRILEAAGQALGTPSRRSISARSLSETPAGVVLPGLPDHPAIEGGDPGLDLAHVLQLQDQESARQRWQPLVIIIRDDGEQSLQAGVAWGRDHPELGHVLSDRVDRAGPLGDQASRILCGIRSEAAARC
jgi:hypothetical protein